MATKENKIVKINPVSVESVIQSDMVAIDIPEGKVLIQPIDKDGNEISVPFFTNERTANRVYSDEKKFLIKKKATLSPKAVK